MKSAAQLKKALSILKSIKVDPEVVRGVANGPVIPVKGRMAVQCMPIQEFLSFIRKVQPIHVQRNDAYRLEYNLAKHLNHFALPQGMFAVVFYSGQFYLVDGNTRKRAWLSCSKMAKPSHVFVTVLVPESLEEAEGYYACYDSKASKKTLRDEMLSLLHAAGVPVESLKSKLVAGGKFVTVARSMAKRYHGCDNADNRAEAVKRHSAQFQLLDALDLNECEIPMGAVWVVLRLYKELPQFTQLVTDFVNEIRLFGTPRAGLVPSALFDLQAKAARACAAEQTGTTGTKACRVMFPVYLMGFATYVRTLSASKVYSRTYLNALTKQLGVLVEAEKALM